MGAELRVDRRQTGSYPDLDRSCKAGFCWPITISIGDDRWMRSTREFLRDVIKLRGEFFHCCIFAGNFTSLSTVQSYLCSD